MPKPQPTAEEVRAAARVILEGATAKILRDAEAVPLLVISKIVRGEHVGSPSLQVTKLTDLGGGVVGGIPDVTLPQVLRNLAGHVERELAKRKGQAESN